MLGVPYELQTVCFVIVLFLNDMTCQHFKNSFAQQTGINTAESDEYGALCFWPIKEGN